VPHRALPGSDRLRGVLSLFGSLALHLSPLLLLLRWTGAPVEMPAPIPVQLVIEEPPPPPPPPPPLPQTAVKPPPPGRLASEEVGAPAPQPDDDAAPSPAAAQPEQQQTAALVPPPKLPPPREPEGLPAPSLVPPPKKPAEAPAAQRPPAKPRPPPRRGARAPGPAATRDEYLAYLATLTRPHLRMLPPDLINGRRGTTRLAIRVLGDGTIARVAVSESSGHPDIDAGVMRMIAAIGRFPPLPQWIQEPSWDINFKLSFPFPAAAIQQR